QVRPLRHLILPTQVFPKQDMYRSRWQPFFASENMSYFHSVVIYDDRKMISRHPVRFQKHLVIDELRLKGDHPTDSVVKGYCFLFRHFDANGMGMPCCEQLLYFLIGEAQRVAQLKAVFVTVSKVWNKFSLFLKLVRCIKCVVRIACSHELFGILTIGSFSFTLTVRAVIARMRRAFVGC